MPTTTVGISSLHATDRIDALRPLYEQLHEHHATVAPQLGPLDAAATAESWARRARRYAAWLQQADAFALLATKDSEPVGYVVATVESGYDGWGGGERIGEVKDLVVDRRVRGEGVGTTLLDAAEAQFGSCGVTAYRLNVIAANADALRLYRERGMTLVAHTLLARIGTPPNR